MISLTTTSTRDNPLPVLPLRDIVVFPHMIVPLFVGREKSVRALEQVMQAGKQVLLVTQKTSTQDDPVAADLYDIGAVATILQLLKLPDGTVKVLVEGARRVRVTSYTARAEFLEAFSEDVKDESQANEELEALARTAATQFEQYVKLNKKNTAGGDRLGQSDRGAGETCRHYLRASCVETRG